MFVNTLLVSTLQPLTAISPDILTNQMILRVEARGKSLQALQNCATTNFLTQCLASISNAIC